eukprot:PITA_35847
MHSSVYGGHHYWITTAYKILRVSYFWPSLFSNVCAEVRTCEKCQRFISKKYLKSLPLKTIIVYECFQQWGLDFIGEIHPPSSGQHHWILVATDYFTKGIEAIPTGNATHKVIINVLEGIITRFRCPSRLVVDNVASFKATPLVNFYEDYGIQLTHSTTYYPQGNGLAKSSNKSLVRIITKLLEQNKRSWDSKFKFDLWPDRVIIKKSLNTSPFQMVYGIDAIFPVQLTIPVAKLQQVHEAKPNDMTRRMYQIIEVQQKREQQYDLVRKYQQAMKEVFDKGTKKEYFHIGDLALKWDAQHQDPDTRTLNLLDFILKSLAKMAARIQTHQEASEYSLYHQAIIKVVVEEELKKRNQTWDHFLF